MFVAALASCHMLWFLSLAATAGWVVDSYQDAAVGTMAVGAQGRAWVSQVTLHPAVQFCGPPPSLAELHALHHQAHAQCFIANSVRTDVRCEPVLS
jgi:organic hydroperoxide reductase OsmC/OhrA